MENNKKNDSILQSLKAFSDFSSENKNKNESSMSVTKAQGFLYSVVSSPCLVEPSDWVITVFSCIPEFESLEHQEKVIEAVLDLYNSIKERLSSHSKENMCLWGESGQIIDIDEASDYMLFEFCSGYIKGYVLDPILKDTFMDLPDLSLSFFLSVLKLCENKNTELNPAVSGEEDKRNITGKMRKAFQALLLDNYITWSQAQKLNLHNSYFGASSEE
jgi:yecA family protein